MVSQTPGWARMASKRLRFCCCADASPSTGSAPDLYRARVEGEGGERDRGIRHTRALCSLGPLRLRCCGGKAENDQHYPARERTAGDGGAGEGGRTHRTKAHCLHRGPSGYTPWRAALCSRSQENMAYRASHRRCCMISLRMQGAQHCNLYKRRQWSDRDSSKFFARTLPLSGADESCASLALPGSRPDHPRLLEA